MRGCGWSIMSEPGDSPSPSPSSPSLSLPWSRLEEGTLQRMLHDRFRLHNSLELTRERLSSAGQLLLLLT